MRHKSLVLVGIGLALLTAAPFAETCGPFLPEIRFTTHNGVLPGEFASGHPGVFRPHYLRRDLLLAYRTFSGIPINHAELGQQPASGRGAVLASGAANSARHRCQG